MRMSRSAGVVVEGHPRVGGEAQVVLDASADAAGQGAMPAADRPGRPGLGRGADQGRGDDQPPVPGQCVGVGESTGGGDRHERQQGVDDLGRPTPAGRHVHAGPQVGGVMVDHGDELAQQMGVA
jgi:hypothetical protein